LKVDDDDDAEMGEGGYGGDAGDNMMDDYQQSGNESELEEDIANEDYIAEEPDDFDVSVVFWNKLSVSAWPKTR